MTWVTIHKYCLFIISTILLELLLQKKPNLPRTQNSKTDFFYVNKNVLNGDYFCRLVFRSEGDWHCSHAGAH